METFNYHRPRDLSAALKLLQNPAAKALAGGHTLLPSMKQKLAAPEDLVDLAQLTELQGIRCSEAEVQIGAMTSHSQVAASSEIAAKIPALAALAAGIGDQQVRNRGTLGGSLANNDPAADYPAAALGLGALLVTDRREIPADEFFIDLFETALEEDEIITRVDFPVPLSAAYVKFPNPASRYAIVGAFVSRSKSGVRVAVTGAAACVFRAAAFEEALSRDFSAGAVSNLTLAEDDMNHDMHASAEYRSHLTSVMIRRAVARLT